VDSARAVEPCRPAGPRRSRGQSTDAAAANRCAAPSLYVAHRAVPRTYSFLSLGALHRTLASLLAPGRDAAISLHFEQRSASQTGDATSAPPELFLGRRFDAQLVTRDGGVVRAELRSSGRSRRPAAWLSIMRRGDAYLYTVDGARFGWLHDRPDLFDLSRFQRRLDSIGVADVTVERKTRDGDNIVVLDADVGVAAFRRLLALFAGDPAEDDLDLRSYSVTLSAGPDVALDYWWSLSGDDRADGDAYRQSIACHVQVRIAPTRIDDSGTPEADTALPELRHIDEVWALARATSGAGAAAV